MRLLLIGLLIPGMALAQLWSGIIDPGRATDWSSAGVQGGIPSATQAGSTINAYTGTAATINNALAACGGTALAPKFVLLGSGTFTLSTGITFQVSNCELRGSGASSTKLIVNGTVSSCGLFYSEAVAMCTSTTNIATTNGGGSGPNHSATWSAGYAQNTTVITLSSTTGLANGSAIWLDQLDDSSDSGNIVVCESAASFCSNQGGNSFARVGRVQTEGHLVTNISGNNVTISPGVMGPNFVSGKSPGAWWGSAAAFQNKSGISNLSLDFTGGGGAGIAMINNNNSWVKGVRLIRAFDATSTSSVTIGTGTKTFTTQSGLGYSNGSPIHVGNSATNWMEGTVNSYSGTTLSVSVSSTSGSGTFTSWSFGGSGSFVFHVLIVNGVHLEVRDNYFYGPEIVGNTQYAIAAHEAASNLYENNIFHGVVAGMIPNDPEAGSVYAFNYVNGLRYSGPVQLHSAGDFMNLYEGNNMPNFIGDVIHGTHHFDTLFRNYLDGYAESASQVNENAGVTLLTRSRFFNVIGNVIGNSHFTAYQADQSANQNAIYETGYQGTGSGTTVPNDSNVARTLMRWGNWDSVTSTNDNGSNDQTGTRWVSAEVPSGIAQYPNPVPATQLLPNSFFLAAKPSTWWGTPWGVPTWPVAGPDVASSNITVATGGHANEIPARLCLENTAVDPAYATTAPNVLAFDAATCYVGSSVTVPTVTTTTAVIPGKTSAVTGGNVTGDGGASVTARGVCYATTANPTSPCTSDGTGTGSYVSSLSGLTGGTLYHYRAFATNSVGTAYGTDQTFTPSVILHLRYGGGAKIPVCGASNATPIVLQTCTDNGGSPWFTVGQIIWVWGVDGDWNADGTRRVTAVIDNTHYALAYCGDSNCTVAGADAAGNGAYATATRIGSWAGTTVAYPMPGAPNVWFDGPSGAITARIKDPDGAGPLKAPRSQTGFPPYDAINNSLSIVQPGGSTMLQDCAWNGTNYAVFLGGHFAPFGAMALLWYGDNSQSAAKTCAIGYLDNIERFVSEETTACDEAEPTRACGDDQALDYATGYNATPAAVAFTLMQDQLTPTEQTAYVNQVLNNRMDGATCTDQYQVGTGTVAAGVNLGRTATAIGTGTTWNTPGPGQLFPGYIIKAGELGYYPKTIVSVDSDTQVTYRNYGDREPPWAFSGSIAYKWAAPWADPNCGIVYFGQHAGYSPISPWKAYPVGSSSGGGIVLADLFGNQFETKLASMLMFGVTTANFDARGVRLTENTANQWNDTFFPLYEKFWTGPTQIDSQYGPDRFGDFTTNVVWPLYNATGGAVNYTSDRWLKDRETWNLYNLLPTSTSAAVRNVGYGTSNLAQSNWSKTDDTVTLPTMTAGSNEAEYFKWWRSTSGTRGDFTASAIPFGTCISCEWAYSMSDPSDGAGTNFTTILPTSHNFSLRNASATSDCPTCGTNVIVDRTGWTSPGDTLWWINAIGEERAPNHLGQLSTGDYGPGGYLIYKKAQLIGDDIGTGKQDASGYYAQNATRTSYFEIGGTGAAPPLAPLNANSALREPNGYGTTGGFGSVPVVRYADGGSGANMNKYMTSMVDASNAYCSAVSGTCLVSANLTRMNRTFFDFKTGQQYMVVADDNATSTGEQERMFLQYPNNGQANEGTTTFTAASNSVSSLTSVSDNAQVNTKVLFPNSDGFTYEDNGIQTLTITNVGAGCTSVPNIALSGDVGNGDAVLVGAIAAGKLSTLTALRNQGANASANPGSGFSVAPTITFSGGGCTTEPTATATISSGGNYYNNSGQTARVSACIGVGTDAHGCSQSATSAEIVTVHQVSANQTATMPTVTMLSTTGSVRALQIADAATPKVACWEHGGTLQTNTTFTTTFTGTAQYICSGFAAGTYNVTVGGVAVSGSPFTVANGDNSLYWESGPGAVNISQSGATGLLIVTPGSLNFSATSGGSNPASQTISISASGIGPPNWTATKGQSWLTVSPASGGGAASPTVSADITGLSAGTYNDTISVASTTQGITNSPQTVGVTLSVNPAVSVTITTQALPSGLWMNSYGPFSLTASGGTGPYTWSIVSGNLPIGISMTTGGVISGIPTQAGEFAIGLVAIDSNSVASNELDLPLQVIQPITKITGNGSFTGNLH